MWDQKELDRYLQDENYLVLTNIAVIPKGECKVLRPLPVAQGDRELADGIIETFTVYPKSEYLDYLDRKRRGGYD